MPDNPPRYINFDPRLAKAFLPLLESAARELQDCLDRYEVWDDFFRLNFRHLFQGREFSVESGDRIFKNLLNARRGFEAAPIGEALLRLRQNADLADLACGMLLNCCRDTEAEGSGAAE